MYCYCIKNKVNGKRYIGITIASLTNRFINHLSSARAGKSTIFYNAIRKYGENNFELEWFDEYNCSQEELYYIEKEEIKKYKTYIGFEDSNGYNMTLGGEGGRKKGVFQIETQTIKIVNEYSSISEASKITGTHQASISNCCLFRKWNKTAGGFLWAFSDNEIYPFSFRRIKIIKDKTFIGKIDTILEASKKLKISQLEVHNLCKSRTTSGKYSYHYY